MKEIKIYLHEEVGKQEKKVAIHGGNNDVSCIA